MNDDYSYGCFKKENEFQIEEKLSDLSKKLFITVHQSKGLQGDYGIILNNNEEY